MTFTKQNLLQINATIIAGILILVSIQSVNSIAPRDMELDGLVYARAGELYLNTSDNFRDTLKEKNFVLSDEQSKILLELEYEKHLEMRYDSSLMLARAQIYQESDLWQKLFLSPSFYATIFIIPFALSSVSELFYLFNNRENEKASRIGISSSILGFAVILSLFVSNLFNPVF